MDYANQLRLAACERRAALIATGKTRMRPILMTTLTTVLAMLQLVFSNDMASQLMSGILAIVSLRPELCHPDDLVYRAHPVRYPLLAGSRIVDVGSDG